MDSLSNPKAIAERGEKLYHDKYQGDLEKSHRGRFVAIDVVSEKFYLGDTPERAYEEAKSEGAKGPFHLMKIGDVGAFRVAYGTDGNGDWLFR